MKHLKQELNTSDDSFSYTVSGESSPRYAVDSHARLTEHGEVIGWFRLGDNQWHLHIGDDLYMSGPENGLFKLPEFELTALTKLANSERSK